MTPTPTLATTRGSHPFALPPMRTTVIALALLLTGCGGSPQATAPTAPAVPASPTAVAPPAAAPAAPAPVPQTPASEPVADLADDHWGVLALAGASMLNERPDKACELIRRAAQNRASSPAPQPGSEALAANMGAEALQIHGARCGVR